MRKGHNGEKNRGKKQKKTGKKEEKTDENSGHYAIAISQLPKRRPLERRTLAPKQKRLMEIVATTPLPAVDRPNADRWNAARSRQYFQIIYIIIEWK